MKKIAVLLSVIMFTVGIAYASKYPKYDAELSKIRTVKNAQTSVLNKQIKEIANNIETLELNTSISTAEKNKKMKEYNAQLDKLTTRKAEIEAKYKSDKQRLKTLYKH